MPSIHFNYGSWWNWETAAAGGYPNQKVVFDGPNKIIFVNEGVTELDVQSDLYSAWKEWKINTPEQGTGLTWDKAFTAVGGDLITDDVNLGVTYFLENGWRIQPFPSKAGYTLTINGNIYTRETGENINLFAEGVSVSLERSNIVEQIRIESLGVNITESDIAAIADEVWNEALSDHVAAGSTGQKLGKIATKIQDIALR